VSGKGSDPTPSHKLTLSRPPDASHPHSPSSWFTDDDVRSGKQCLTDSQVMQLFEPSYQSAVSGAQRAVSSFSSLCCTVQEVMIDMDYNLGGEAPVPCAHLCHSPSPRLVMVGVTLLCLRPSAQMADLPLSPVSSASSIRSSGPLLLTMASTPLGAAR
jgi:hypothetical protein